MEVSGVIIVALLLASLVLTCFLSACVAIIRRKLKQRKSGDELKLSEESSKIECKVCFSAIHNPTKAQYNSQNFCYLPSGIRATEEVTSSKQGSGLNVQQLIKKNSSSNASKSSIQRCSVISHQNFSRNTRDGKNEQGKC